ncbi:608_t:CDS:2 [Racocetra fulgida]|uniref:608_t:CDS:1 n=1 Tax=Racocetra fulgida TaxID=60492 RepID=A0A9N9AHM3_9GLOM|nr:608_t:CDS:2 [Racocetra fulgida]
MEFEFISKKTFYEIINNYIICLLKCKQEKQFHSNCKLIDELFLKNIRNKENIPNTIDIQSSDDAENLDTDYKGKY